MRTQGFNSKLSRPSMTVKYRFRQTVQRIRDRFEIVDIDVLGLIPKADHIADGLTKWCPMVQCRIYTSSTQQTLTLYETGLR